MNFIEEMESLKNEEIESTGRSIKSAGERLNKLMNLDLECIDSMIKDVFVEYDIPMSTRTEFYIYSSRVDVNIYDCNKTYEDIIEMDDARLSYNGNYMQCDIEINNDVVDIEIHYEARVPDEVTALLRACGKIEDVESIQTTAMC